MKAAQINAYGGSEVVEVNSNAPEPSPVAGKVLVEVYAAGVNPVDWKIREGYLQQMAPLQFPATLGLDFSGVVKEVGPDVAEFKEADEVYGQAGLINNGSGSFAELAVADTKKIAHKPKGVSYEEAAALPLPAVSAWQGLVDHIHLKSGQKILIHGGAGGIGAFAIQIAKHMGAHVATTASADDATYVKDSRADEVIDYKTQRFEDVVHDYDAVFDTVGGETYERSFKVLRRGGVIVSMVEQPRQDLMEQYGVIAIAQGTQVTGERLSKLAQFVEQGVIKVLIDKAFPLDQAAEALTYLQTKHSRGKVVLTVWS